MMRVVLILTGKMERCALGDSLSKLFPDVEFEIEPPLDTEDFYLPKSFTSSTLPFRCGSAAEQNIDLLVNRLAASVEPGRKGKGRPDLVVLIEDLELGNVEQPAVVLSELANAVNRHITKLRDDPRRRLDPEIVAEALRTRASFHLMVPMTEAYFFGDMEALAIATPRSREISIIQEQDVERFESNDTNYLAPIPSDAQCTRSQDRRCPWSSENRAVHPKKYVQYLSRSLSEPYCTDYRETHEGANALRALRWNIILENPQAAPYARALIIDIANALAKEYLTQGVESPITSIFKRPRPNILRNV